MNALKPFTHKSALIACLISLFFIITAQTKAQRSANKTQRSLIQLQQDTAQASAWRLKAQTFLKAARYDSALVYFQQAAMKYDPYLRGSKDTSIWKDYLQCNNQMGICYWRLSDYRTSEELLINTLEKGKKYLGQTNLVIAESLNQLGIVYDILGDYKKALANHQDALAIRLSILGEKHAEVARTYTTIGIVHYRQSNSEEALSNFQKALAIQEVALEKNHPSFGITYANIGMVYREQGLYEEALKYYRKALEVDIIALGEEHHRTAIVYGNIGTIYHGQGKYEEALEHFQNALKIKKVRLSKTDLSLAYTHIYIGFVYKSQGKYEKALESFQKALQIRLANLGEESAEVAQVYDNFGMIYRLQGNYNKSIEYSQKAIDILHATLKNPHPYLAIAYRNVGIAFEYLADYAKTLEYYQKALEIRLTMYDKNHPNVAESYTDIGIVYWLQGSFDKSLDYYKKALSVYSAKFDKNNPNLATSYENIALAYKSKGLYAKALEYLQKSLSIHLDVYGEDHFRVAGAYYNMGVIYKEQHNYEEALKYLQSAAKIDSIFFAGKHDQYANSLNGLGVLYTQIGRHEEAEFNLLKGKAIREELLGKIHPDYVQSIDNLGNLYALTSRREKAASLYLEASSIDKQLLAKGALHLSENELAAYTKLFRDRSEKYYSFVHTSSKASDTLRSLCFNNALFHKGFLLNAAYQINNLAISKPVSKEKINSLKAYRRRLAKEYTKPIAKRLRVNDIEEKANALEKELVRTVAGLGEVLRQVNWPGVQAALQPGEAAVEFVRYKFYTPDPTDSTFYAALVLRPGDDQPHFVPLFEEKALQVLLDQDHEDKKEYLTDLYIRSSKKKTSLYELIWRPVAKLLRQSHTLYIAPSGLLHQINLGAVMVGKNRTWDDQHKVFIMGSTRQLALSKEEEKKRPLVAQIYGGVQYEMDSLSLKQAVAAYEKVEKEPGALSFSGMERSERGNTWLPLPGAEQEAEKVNALILQAGGDASLLKGYQATEESFLQMGRGKPSPRVLHIATHGYFYPNIAEEDRQTPDFDKKSAFKISEHPMIRSGLILAGGNYKWQTKQSLPGVEDGVLTAYEVSQTNLRNTELVVLSACDTGLGDIEGNEGVYGLQRAFKIAGAQKLIMSLWKVPDEQTQEMMTVFYRNWLEEGKSIPDAFRAARRTMRKKYKDHYYWAAFVLVE